MIRPRKIFKKAEAQWWLCFHCFLPMTPETVTKDHLIPRAKGGSGRAHNIVAACGKCNWKKADGTQVPAGYLRKRQQTHYRSVGLTSKKPRGEFRDLMPNFGRGPDGAPLWAPQYGLV